MKIYYYLLLTLTLNSCLSNSSCTKLSLSKEEQSWFTNYRDNEIRLYKSQSDDIDTFVVSVKPVQSYSLCNRIELGEYQYGFRNVSFLAKECHGLDDMYCDFTMRFTKEFQNETDQKCNKRFSFFDLRSEKMTDLSELPMVIDTLRYLNKSTKSYVFENGAGVKDANAGYCFFDNFHVNKEYGLVKYQTRKGDVYEFWKKL